MRVVWVIFLLFASSAFAGKNEALLEQLSSPQFKYDVPDTFSGTDKTMSGVVKVSKEACAKLDEKRSFLAKAWGTPRHAQILSEVKALSGLCYVDVKTNQNGDIVAINFENNTKNKINPMSSANPSSRQFRFEFGERSKTDLALRITENSGVSGKMSHDLLETTIIFIPRKVVPYVDLDNSKKCQYKLVLPTNEFIIFDAITKEIIAGAIKEEAMDMNKSRHKRKFAGMNYEGRGIMIRADRRSGTAEHIYSSKFNQNEKIKEATLTHRGKTCMVKKQLIWKNAKDANKKAIFKYDTDQDFLDLVVNPICGWDLTLNDLE